MSEFKYKQIPPFLDRKGDSLVFNKKEGYLAYYIPEFYFTSNYAQIDGEYISILGLLDYTIFDNNGKHGDLKPFKFPSLFLCKPSEIEKIKDVKLTATSKTNDYSVLKFKYGDEVISSVFVPQDISYTEEFYKMFLYGKLPTTIKYTELQDYFLENIRINGNSYKVNAQLFGVIVGEVSRDLNDPSKLFRHTDMKNMYSYQPLDIRQTAKYASSYSAFTSENWDEALINSIMNKEEKYIPMEKLLMG